MCRRGLPVDLPTMRFTPEPQCLQGFPQAKLGDPGQAE